MFVKGRPLTLWYFVHNIKINSEIIGGETIQKKNYEKFYYATFSNPVRY